MLIVRALFVWLGIIAMESLQGILRMTLVEPVVGAVPARQAAVVTGSLLVLLIAWITAPALGLRNSKQAFAVGGLWVALTSGFDLALGRAMGLTWQRLWSDYDLANGGLLPLGLVAMLLAPWIAMRLRH